MVRDAINHFGRIQGAAIGKPRGWDAARQTLLSARRVILWGERNINLSFDPPTHKASAGQAAEATQESAKVINSHRVARLFAKKCVGGREEGSRDVVLTRDRCGYTPCDRAFFLAKIRCNVTYHNFSTIC